MVEALVDSATPCTRGDDSDHGPKAQELGITAIACGECGREYPVAPVHVCEFCFAPLQIVYDYGAIAALTSRASISAGPASIWRYQDLLPVPRSDRVDLGAGWSPLRPAPRLGKRLGLDALWIKNDIYNPTGSFKDRVVSVALSAARFFGLDTVACASTGNLANSVAAHAAGSGLSSIVFIPADLEIPKIVGSSIYGGSVVAVPGTYDDVNRLCAELASIKPWGFVNVNLRPFYSEGSKTVAFETVEQLGWRVPDAFVIPVASGSLLTKIARGLKELHLTGLIETPSSAALFGAQAAGCAPIARAFAAGADLIEPVRPATIARSLAIGNPADGYYVLDEVRKSGGAVAAVDDDEIRGGIDLLARTEGIFTETAGGVTIATLERLVAEGAIARDQEVVAVITGSGLKTPDALDPPAPLYLNDATIGSVGEALGGDSHARGSPRSDATPSAHGRLARDRGEWIDPRLVD